MSAESETEAADAPVQLVVSADEVGMRLDAFLAARLTEFSRVQLRRAINDAQVTVGGAREKASYRLGEGQQVVVTPPEASKPAPLPEEIPLEFLHEDEAIAVVNKPPNMVVHPAKGHWSGTLVAGLAWHLQNLSSVGGPARPGIVHRLDRDTSGVIIIAKTDFAHQSLAAQFEARTVSKEYFAIGCGNFDRDADWVDQPIAPHPSHREKMAIRADHPQSREASTFLEVEERFTGFTVFKAMPKTGRTHQIRLHLAHVGCAVLCDKLYGGRSVLTQEEVLGRPPGGEVVLDRQALHARSLSVDHPLTGKRMTFSAPLPEDLEKTLKTLRSHRAKK